MGLSCHRIWNKSEARARLKPKQGPKRHQPRPIQKFKEFKTIEDIAVSQSVSEKVSESVKFSEIFKKFQKDSEIFRKFQKVPESFRKF